MKNQVTGNSAVMFTHVWYFLGADGHHRAGDACSGVPALEAVGERSGERTDCGRRGCVHRGQDTRIVKGGPEHRRVNCELCS